ncbi:MAG: rod shape-determining protein MreC [Candidatus Jorgensenbacteria bacterium]
MKSFRAALGIGAGVLLIALLVVFRAEFVGALARFRATLGAAADTSFTYDAFKNLEHENAELKARLDSAAAVAPARERAYAYLTARVYSRYPVGSGGRLTVDAGSEDGVREGMPVLLSPGTLIGKVAAVKRTQSEVLTVWSSDWKSAVSIVPAGPKALLQGGNEPRLELVPKSAAPAAGARAVNASPEFPLGLLVGAVGESLAGSSNELWSSYRLTPPADEAVIDSVLVVLNFP